LRAEAKGTEVFLSGSSYNWLENEFHRGSSYNWIHDEKSEASLDFNVQFSLDTFSILELWQRLTRPSATQTTMA
jgi:hypothetical protein